MKSPRGVQQQRVSHRPADLAREHGISPQAVRNYERDRLLPVAERTPSDIVATARLPPHGPLCHGSLMVFSSMLRTSMSTMLGLRPQEPLSCLNRKMGRQRDDTELRI
jgi:hypothetical protein